MDIFSVISIGITVIGFIIKLTSGGDSNNSYSHYEASVPADPFPETTLDAILICYETFKLHGFDLRYAEMDLRNNSYSAFKVLSATLKGRCLYLNVQFDDVFEKKSKNNQVVTMNHKVSTYFSVNYLAETNNVMIYGCTNYNQRIKEGYRDVAKEIRQVISR